MAVTGGGESGGCYGRWDGRWGGRKDVMRDEGFLA